MSVNSKMTAIADEVRELSGTTGAMGLDAMANILHTENTSFNNNLSTQDDLITQIKNVVDSLPEAGGDVEITSMVYISTAAPTSSDGNDGDIWIVRDGL